MVNKALRCIFMQVPDEEKRRCADFVLDTSLSIEETREHVAALIKALQGRQGKVGVGGKL